MPASAAVVSILAVGFWIYCAVDLSRTDDREIRLYDRRIWALVLVFTNVFGGLFWLLKGRPQGRQH